MYIYIYPIVTFKTLLDTLNVAEFTVFKFLKSLLKVLFTDKKKKRKDKSLIHSVNINSKNASETS